MIPTMILVGLLLGRWWRLALVLGAISWPALLFATNVMDFESGLLAAAVLGVVNTGVGVLLHQGILGAIRLSPRNRLPDHAR